MRLKTTFPPGIPLFQGKFAATPVFEISEKIECHDERMCNGDLDEDAGQPAPICQERKRTQQEQEGKHVNGHDHPCSYEQRSRSSFIENVSLFFLPVSGVMRGDAKISQHADEGQQNPSFNP